MDSNSAMMAFPIQDQNMNCDSSMMYFPTRDQFLASYLRQLFSLPDSMIYYILKNPKSSKVYQKLIQCCKYFFIKNPILVFHCLQIGDDGWKICSDNCKNLECTKEINVNIQSLNGSKIWIQNKIRILSTDSKCASDLIPYTYQCDAEQFEFHDQKISPWQFLFCSGTVKFLYLLKVQIYSDADSKMPLEDIIANVPNVKRFAFVYSENSMDNVSKDTVKKILQIPHFKNISNFELFNISEDFDIDTLYKYYLAHNELRFVIFCHLSKFAIKRLSNETSRIFL